MSAARTTLAMLALLVAAGWMMVLAPAGDAQPIAAPDEGRQLTHQWTLEEGAATVIDAELHSEWLGDGGHQMGDHRVAGEVAVTTATSIETGATWEQPVGAVIETVTVEVSPEERWVEETFVVDLLPATESAEARTYLIHTFEHWTRQAASDDGVNVAETWNVETWNLRDDMSEAGELRTEEHILVRGDAVTSTVLGTEQQVVPMEGRIEVRTTSGDLEVTTVDQQWMLVDDRAPVLLAESRTDADGTSSGWTLASDSAIIVEDTGAAWTYLVMVFATLGLLVAGVWVVLRDAGERRSRRRIMAALDMRRVTFSAWDHDVGGAPSVRGARVPAAKGARDPSHAPGLKQVRSVRLTGGVPTAPRAPPGH